MSILVDISKRSQTISGLILPLWMILSIAIEVFHPLQKLYFLDYVLAFGALVSCWGIGVWIMASAVLLINKKFIFNIKTIVFFLFLAIFIVSILSASKGPTNARELF